MPIRALIVDDSSVMRKIVERSLRQAGIDLTLVFQAGNGAEALVVLKDNPVDLILCDINMPVMDGLEIENLVKSEASLCYRLLRYLNSAVFGFANEIHSVRHALSILGEREVRRWIRLVATLGAGQGKTSDLVLAAGSRTFLRIALSQNSTRRL
jgi:CheY-like chemotaxis protein